MDTTTYIKWIALLFILTSASAHSASFDCKLARSQIELLICESDELSSLDDQLGKSYGLVMQDASPEDQSQLKKSKYVGFGALEIDAQIPHAYQLLI